MCPQIHINSFSAACMFDIILKAFNTTSINGSTDKCHPPHHCLHQRDWLSSSSLYKSQRLIINMTETRARMRGTGIQTAESFSASRLKVEVITLWLRGVTIYHEHGLCHHLIKLSSCEDYYVIISSYYDDPVVQVQRTQKSEQMVMIIFKYLFIKFS